MCDVKDPCCIVSPFASKVSCMAKGGKPDTNPCNVMNPMASTTSCNAKPVVDNVGKLPQWAIFLIAVVILGIVLLVFFMMLGGSTSYGGGKRILGLSRIMKRFF